MTAILKLSRDKILLIIFSAVFFGLISSLKPSLSPFITALILVATVIPYVTKSIIELFWIILWFWLGLSYILPIFLPNNLYMASAISSAVSIFISSLIILLWLYKPLKFSFSLSKWVVLYMWWVLFMTILSPYVYKNPLRTFGFLASEFFIIAALLICIRFLDVSKIVKLASIPYLLSLFITTLMLITHEGISSHRFGNKELLHPNVLGFLYGTGFCFILGIKTSGFKENLVKLFILIFLGSLVILTFSKTSILSLLISLFIVALFIKRNMISYLMILTSAIILFGLIFREYITNQIIIYTSNLFLLSTLTGRTIIWSWVIEMLSKNPLIGYGYATFRDIFTVEYKGIEFHVPPTQAHNAFMDALFVGGIIGLLLFSILIIRSYYFIIKTAYKLKGDPNAILLASMSSFIFIRSITEGSLNLGRDFIFWIFLLYYSFRLSKSLK